MVVTMFWCGSEVARSAADTDGAARVHGVESWHG